MNAIFSNIHTHTTYCDGKNRPEEIIEKAISLGFRSIGFSGHSYVEFDQTCGMDPANEKMYYDELSYLRDKYKGTIDVLIGIERDFYTNNINYDYDYIIGSVHYIKIDGDVYPVDSTPDMVISAINKLNGDKNRYLDIYFNNLYEMISHYKMDVIGHIDLYRKFDDEYHIFDMIPYNDTVDKIINDANSKGLYFEINTGAMARRYRKEPYPSLSLLKKMIQKGCKFVLTSDAHSLNNLDYWFEECIEYIKKLGLNYLYQFKSEGIIKTELKS